MEIDIRAAARLRGSAGAQAAVRPIVEALCGSDADLATVRVVCDWIQYQANFRETAMVRPVLAADDTVIGAAAAAGAAAEACELAVDLRRCAQPETDVAAEVTAAILDTNPDRVWLEPWAPSSASCVWRFNALFWQALVDWEKATGREYEQTLPGGESDARNAGAARETILDLFKIWDELASRRALPEQLYVLELGVGNGGQARTWLDQFVELDRRHGRDYYRRLHYLMGDYSAHVLDRARAEVAPPRRPRVRSRPRRDPAVGDRRLPGRARRSWSTSPTSTTTCRATRWRPSAAGSTWCRPGRSCPARRPTRSPPGSGSGGSELAQLTQRLLRIGPELLAESLPEKFPDTGQAVLFWQAVWAALRQAERYVPLEGLDTYRIAPGLTGEILRSLLSAEGDIRMHVSNGALASFADTLPLLHPFGRVVCHDLFTTGAGEYRSGFYGPGKYDGSVVNWVNGPLLQLLASRRGYDVRFSAFKQRPGSHVKTLTAAVRD